MAKKITMQDIADALKISKCTVSLAISDKYGVSDELRSEIILTAISLGYNFSKARINRKKTKKEIVLISGFESYMNSEYWIPIIKAIEKSVKDRGCRLKIIFAGRYAGYGELLADISSPFLSGVIIMSGESDKELVAGFEKLSIPIALLDSRNYAGMKHPQVFSGNYSAGVTAAEYFIAKGHKKLCFVGSKRFSQSFNQRMSGFRDTAESYLENGVSCVICSGDLTLDKFYNVREVEAAFSGGHPTAVFCVNDSVAYALYGYLSQINPRVPDDVSLIGFDNIDYGVLGDGLKLTTFNVHKSLLGEKIVELLFGRISGVASEVEIINIAADFTEGNTVKAL